MKHSQVLSLDNRARIQLWEQIVETIETYLARVRQARVAPELDPEKIRSLLIPQTFAQPLSPRQAVDFAVRGLWDYQVHTPHPRYFGLFNPAPTTMGIAADALVAAFNPQLATWTSLAMIWQK